MEIWKCDKKICGYSGTEEEVEDHINLLNAECRRNNWDLSKVHAWGMYRVGSKWDPNSDRANEERFPWNRMPGMPPSERIGTSDVDVELLK
jgi:hypothetical protein